MAKLHWKLTHSFSRFFESKKSAGIVLILCTILSLAITNSPWGENYLHCWKLYFFGLTIEHWINDGLMTIFFLLIGLELERELYSGELSDFQNALLPIVAAVGGILVPASIHFMMNAGTVTQPGLGIPMATDIAFALGVLALLGSRIPAALKIFLTALAVIDDLGAVVVIAIFYTAKLSIHYLFYALVTFSLMLIMNRVLRVMTILPYLIGGVVMWYFMLKSGVHATITGVALAFAIPFSPREQDTESPSHKLEHYLHKPVAFIVLPIFALANTGIVFGSNWAQSLADINSLGIMLGLTVGKPLGILLFTFAAVALGICKLPSELHWKHILGAGCLGGIGFTMSIFITNLAFPENVDLINSSKMAILLASVLSGVIGYMWLRCHSASTADK